MVLVALTLGAGACGPAAPKGNFNSDNPAARLYAIRRAGAEKDRSALGHLVKALEREDPAVRLMAIEALQRITDTRLGYNPYAPPPARRKAVKRWEEALAEDRFAPEKETEGASEEPSDAPTTREGDAVS
jgi:HEAT repeat protein